jgi:hypothetical protein
MLKNINSMNEVDTETIIPYDKLKKIIKLLKRNLK